jgi:hypothetical protein
MQRNIPTPKNIDVDEINNAILESLSEESHTYLSTNSLIPTEEGVSVAAGVSMDSLYSVEILNTLQFSGIANHKLELKVGVPIFLLRNLNQSIKINQHNKSEKSFIFYTSEVKDVPFMIFLSHKDS